MFENNSVIIGFFLMYVFIINFNIVKIYKSFMFRKQELSFSAKPAYLLTSYFHQLREIIKSNLLAPINTKLFRYNKLRIFILIK